MPRYKVDIKRVSGSLNGSSIPKKSLIIESASPRTYKNVFQKAASHLKKKYGLTLENADISPAPINLEELYSLVERHSARGSWNRGVKECALELINNVIEHGYEVYDCASFEQAALNGARDWRQFSRGACSLVHDGDIIDKFCSPSRAKRYKLKNNQFYGSRENPTYWIDTQANAFAQACDLCCEYIREMA